MSYLSPGNANKRPLWQTLLAPMLLASLGLHGLFLLIPMASSDEAVIPPPDPEQDNIAITRIPPAATATAQPSAATTTGTQAMTQRPVATATAPARPAPGPTPASPPPTAPQAVQPRPGARPSNPPNSSALPNLPEQGNSSDTATSRPLNPNPSVSNSRPTIPALGQNRRDNILAYVAGLDLSQARIDQLAANIWRQYGYSVFNTSRGEYTDNLTQWQNDLQAETGLADLTAEEDRTEFKVEIDRRVCLVEPPGDIKIGFVVNPDGSLRQDPVLLRSSGYEDLNQQAMDRVSQYQPPATDAVKAYTVTVETGVNYGAYNCLAAPQQPSATNADT